MIFDQELNLFYRPLAEGIGEAVARRTFLRKLENGEYENWAHVADRTSKGNCGLHKSGEKDLSRLRELIAKGAIMLSGRQLQHGDENQSENGQEKYVNCATSLTTHMLFYLALNGCGIGTSYDDELVVVDWNFAPKVICVMSEQHPDFKESKAQSKEKFEESQGKIDHVMGDSRVGWAKAVEEFEVIAFKNQNSAMINTFVIDCSDVRPENTPIAGMQGRPASGPNPLIEAFYKVNAIIEKTKQTPMKPWKIKMHVDHYFGACVMFGGVRRIARAAYKFWKDPGIFDFIDIKQDGELWSANNSVAVDEEFWQGCMSGNAKCLMILARATEAAYYHNSGEPGLLNIDKLVQNNEGLEKYLTGELQIGSSKYIVSEEAQEINRKIFENLMKSEYKHGVNPCVTGSTCIRTSAGFMPVRELLGVPFKAVIDGKEYQSGGFYQTGTKSTLLLETNRQQLLECTSNHKILTRNGWKEARFLNVGDLVINGQGESEIISIQENKNTQPVYDCSVDEVHRFEALDEYCFTESIDRSLNVGIIVHNCFEISLQHNSGFCVLADIFGYNADTLDEVIESAKHSVRSTIRLNLMDSVYGDEVRRTNRIGVSFVGWHEFAWKFFRLSFRDLIDEKNSQHFWDFINDLNQIVIEEADRYADELGVVRPHTITCIKPAGCRLWNSLTVTDQGIYTIEDFFWEHNENETWSDYKGAARAVNDDGVTQKITKTYKNGLSKTVKVKLVYGTELEVTPNHQFYVKDNKNSKEYRWIQAKDIKPGNIVYSKLGTYNKQTHSKFKIINNEAIKMRQDCGHIKQPEFMNPDLAWLIGYLWGDGAMSPMNYRLRFMDQNIIHLEKTKRIIKEQFGIDVDIKSCNNKDAGYIEFGNKILWHWLLKNEIFKYHANEIDLIPRIVRESSKEDIIAFMAGMFDADGCTSIRYKHPRKSDGKFAIYSCFTQKSKLFADHFQQIGHAVGLHFGCSHNTAGKNLQKNKSMYLLTLNSGTDKDSLDLMIKHSNKFNRVSNIENTYWIGLSEPKETIGKVREVLFLEEEKDTYDIEVENSHYYYIGGVKSHNSTSKVWSITEGIHLPAMKEYLRWVQFKSTDPLVDDYELRGYPVRRDLKNYEGSVIVGFPTQPEICKLDMGDKLVTISEATIQEQFQWLFLIEKYWIVGVNKDGTPREDRGNQISATIKFKPEDLSYNEFYKAVLEWQPKIKCASIMPQVDATAYEYQPEEPITREKYDELVAHINGKKDEDVDFEHVDCAGGFCPIDFSK